MIAAVDVSLSLSTVWQDWVQPRLVSTSLEADSRLLLPDPEVVGLPVSLTELAEVKLVYVLVGALQSSKLPRPKSDPELAILQATARKTPGIQLAYFGMGLRLKNKLQVQARHNNEWITWYLPLTLISSQL